MISIMYRARRADSRCARLTAWMTARALRVGESSWRRNRKTVMPKEENPGENAYDFPGGSTKRRRYTRSHANAGTDVIVQKQVIDNDKIESFIE